MICLGELERLAVGVFAVRKGKGDGVLIDARG